MSLNEDSSLQAVAAALRLPAVPPAGFWDETQWAVFWSMMEAALPSIREASSVEDENHQIKLDHDQYSSAYELVKATMKNPPSEDKFHAYLDYNASADPDFRNSIIRTLYMLPGASQRSLGGALTTLSGRTGSWFLTGYFPAVNQQPLHIREAILQGWQTSRLSSMRVLTKVFTTLAQKATLQTSPLFKELTGYTDLPSDHEPVDSYEFKFMQFPASDEPVSLETDAVIVGSGCGGAVVAKHLAEAGHRVLVVDKSYHFPAAQLPLAQDMGCEYLFEGGGFLGSDDSCLNLVAGSCWGGGGNINWSVSLQTQGFVRSEWAKKGLPFFTSAQFQSCLDKVSDVMGVSSDHVRHNHRNRVMLDGARKLGWHAAAAPQNTGGTEHYCGRCHLGCGSAGKKGTAVSWLPAAAEAGAECIEGLEVNEVTFDTTDGDKKATGVVGTWVSRDATGGVSSPSSERITRKVVIKAKKVIVACGSLWSPLVLLKSGLTNRHIGQNLYVHPCNMVGAYWKEEVTPWEGKHNQTFGPSLLANQPGGIITSYSTAFENLDGAGHGVKLEPTCAVPYTVLTSMPWHSGLSSKLAALKYRHFGGFIALTRERDPGYVYPDPRTGRPRIAYTPSDFDRAHTLEGVVALAKICYIEGAEEIQAFFPGLEPFVRGEARNEEGEEAGVNDPAFTAWLERVRAVGNKPPNALFTSAHQMGTCRMAANEDEGVVDPRGRVFGTEGLYVADASVFPSASGVNPMITNMAIAEWIAMGVSKELKEV
ncbi:hypothetical protein VD0002_g3083 [Verticillium dahliae]|nr:hypothetical protein VD0002_g3083 [Verticillium dahliae]